ncbi:MAG: hypothetical protein ISN29_03845 [Gammaproteobacteria bacterium AqS3]|nr:hypothetical protein [Gammaproteobacteria bacterium AqS3]
MDECLERIFEELKGLGYDPYYADWPQGKKVVIKYRILTGKYANQTVLLGVSNPDGPYPEYPPHWIHISPLHDDGLGGPVEIYSSENEKGQTCEWGALSRPPRDIWDQLPEKSMKSFLNEHVGRFCKALK